MLRSTTMKEAVAGALEIIRQDILGRIEQGGVETYGGMYGYSKEEAKAIEEAHDEFDDTLGEDEEVSEAMLVQFLLEKGLHPLGVIHHASHYFGYCWMLMEAFAAGGEGENV